MNAMMYVRGHAWDYDRWAALGNEGWAFADVLPYFKKAEHQQRGADTYHGVGGPLHIADLRSSNPLTHAFVEAGRALGLAHNPDVNGQTQEGIGLTQVTQKNGQRWSAADAYLRPAMKRTNLTVHAHAHAMRILFEDGRAVGVAYRQGVAQREARARREVILCGGAINSPHLLLLSGVGPADHLRQWGIPVVADLPGVGQNLQDHPAVAVTYQCTQPVTLAGAQTISNIVSFLVFKKGPLTSNIVEGLAFIKTRDSLPVPDVELVFIPAYFMEHGFANPVGHGFSIGVILLRPDSRGEIRLRSRDPLAAPLIRPNSFGNPQDLQPLVAGVRLARRLAHTDPLAAYRGSEVWPGEGVQDDAALAGFIRAHFQTAYHPVGTCRMGGDEAAVVDAQLRVRNVAGLRVVDASVMPTIIGGHAHAPTVMIAERATDLIRGPSGRPQAPAGVGAKVER